MWGLYERGSSEPLRGKEGLGTGNGAQGRFAPLEQAWVGSPSDPSVHPQPGHPPPSVLRESGHPTLSLNYFWAQLTCSPTVHTAAAYLNSPYFHICISHRGWKEKGEGKGHREGG